MTLSFISDIIDASDFNYGSFILINPLADPRTLLLEGGRMLPPEESGKDADPCDDKALEALEKQEVARANEIRDRTNNLVPWKNEALDRERKISKQGQAADKLESWFSNRLITLQKTNCYFITAICLLILALTISIIFLVH